MSDKANQAVYTLYQQTVYALREFARNQKEMDKLESSYFRYAECANQDLRLRQQIRRRYGLMGVHFPKEFVSPEMAKKMSPLDKTNSGIIRDQLKLWEVLEEFLTVSGHATYTQFRSFLSELKFPEPSAQAVASAIKTHPEIFEERLEHGDKLISLKRT